MSIYQNELHLKKGGTSKLEQYFFQKGDVQGTEGVCYLIINIY